MKALYFESGLNGDSGLVEPLTKAGTVGSCWMSPPSNVYLKQTILHEYIWWTLQFGFWCTVVRYAATRLHAFHLSL